MRSTIGSTSLRDAELQQPKIAATLCSPMSFFGQFGIRRRVGTRIDDRRLERAAQQSAARVLLLDQHDEQLLQRPLARRHGAGQRMQDADLDRPGFEVGEVAARSPRPATASGRADPRRWRARSGRLRRRCRPAWKARAGRCRPRRRPVRRGCRCGRLPRPADRAPRSSWRLTLLIVVTLADTPAMASTVSFTACWMPLMCAPISPVALAVCWASVFTSEATTAKPRPAAPARAASMVALSASKEVCDGDRLDQLDHRADALGGGGEAADRTVGAREIGDAALGRIFGEGGFAAPNARSARAIRARRRRPRRRRGLREAAASTAIAVRWHISVLRTSRSAAVTRISSPAD